MRTILLKLKRLFCKAPDVSRFDSKTFTPPFRLGWKQKRAILDANGAEVIIFPNNSEGQAKMYCDYLNGL